MNELAQQVVLVCYIPSIAGPALCFSLFFLFSCFLTCIFCTVLTNQPSNNNALSKVDNELCFCLQLLIMHLSTVEHSQHIVFELCAALGPVCKTGNNFPFECKSMPIECSVENLWALTHSRLPYGLKAQHVHLEGNNLQ